MFSWCILYYPMLLLADSEGPDQTAHLHSLIRAFAVRIYHKTQFRMALLMCGFIQKVHNIWTYLNEPKSQHQDKVTYPVEGKRETHSGCPWLLSENLWHHDEWDRSWKREGKNINERQQCQTADYYPHTCPGSKHFKRWLLKWWWWRFDVLLSFQYYPFQLN